MKRARAFTLVEILVVVVLLAILAVVIVPMISGGVTSAKGSSVAVDLNTLRRYVLVYAAQHGEVPPGYPDGDRTQAPTEQAFVDQLTLCSNAGGQTAPLGTPGFPRGSYVMMIPVNPLNHKNTVQVLADGDEFPADGDDSHGWIYKPATGEVRADSAATDENGKQFYDY